MTVMKKSIFVIGDSISCYYGRHLEGMLEGRFAYDRKGGTHKLADLDDNTDGVNGGDSSNVLTYLAAMKERWSEDRPDYLLLNCGLHDIKRPVAGPCQVPIDRYEANLRAICESVRGVVGQMLWVRTTPVIDLPADAAPPDVATSRSNRDVIAYNEVADAVMRSAAVPTLDLYGFTRNLGSDIYMDGRVHFTQDAAAKQAAFIAGFLVATAG